MKTEIIKNRTIKPFNDIYTHDCFMNTLLCTAKYYQLDYPILTLCSGFSLFMVGEQLCRKIENLFSIDDLALAIGLEIKKENDCIDYWIEQYKSLFDQDAIIIAPVDDYYNPLRMDVYHKKHLPHYILIYNMDNIQKELLIIESRYRETVLYKNLKIKYDDFEKAHFHSQILYKYILKKRNSIIKPVFKKEYIHKSIEFTEKSIYNLKNYIDYLLSNRIKDNKEWLKNLNEICNQVKIEQYIFQNVFCSNNIVEVVKAIYETWYFIRTQVFKLVMVGYSNNILIKIVSYLRRIESLERDKLHMLHSLSLL